MADSRRTERSSDLPPSARELLRRGELALRRGDRVQALECARRALKACPRHPEVLRHFAAALSAHGPSAEALAAMEEAIRQRPDDPVMLTTHAIVLDSNGRHGQAIESFRKATSNAPDSAAFAYNLGRALSNCGDSAGSLEALDHALRLDPDNRDARATLAEVLRRLGRTREAVAQLRNLLRRDPNDARAWSALAAFNTVTFDAGDVAAMQHARTSAALDADPQVRLDFALGKALADCNRYDESLAAYSRANALVRARVAWNGPGHSAFASAVLEAFARPLHEMHTDQGSQMIFIVSLPRSGSTLVEQILSAHPNVKAGEERNCLIDTIVEECHRRKQPLTQWARHATSDDWLRLGRNYLARSADWRGSSMRATDKLPGNWMYLGAAMAMLPGARVVECRRDLLETAWSCFCHLFKIGTQDFCFDFDSIAAYARDYERVMRQWHEQFPGQIRTQRHESLIADPQTQIRELLAFVGLAFDPACLHSHDVSRSVRTASAAQVREPMRRETARAGKYGALLDPLRLALGLPPFADS
ncbi:MAG: sulfotransferase [Rudaea sp.]